MSWLSLLHQIKWRYVMGANLSLLVLAGLLVTLKPVTTSTENRSLAAPLPSPLTSVYVDKDKIPALTDVDIGWGKVGDAVVVRGSNLGKVPFGVVKIGAVTVPVENLLAWEENYLAFTIPHNATTNVISLTFETTLREKVELMTKNELRIVGDGRN